MAYVKKIWKDYPDTTTPIKAEALNNIENGIEEIDAGLETKQNNNGWLTIGETVTFASADTPTFVVTTSIDCTGFVGLGNRLKCTHEGSVKYFLITAITSNSITLYGGTDYTLSNSLITDVYYSNIKAPFGFPLNPDKWTLKKEITSNYFVSSPSSSVFYGPDVLSLNIPKGVWEISYQVGVQISATVSQYCSANISTSPTTLENNTGLTDNQSIPVAGTIAKRFRANKKVELTEKKTYYFMFKNDTAYTDLYIIGSATSISSMQAVCNYL